jgi:hypothetical protein
MAKPGCTSKLCFFYLLLIGGLNQKGTELCIHAFLTIFNIRNFIKFFNFCSDQARQQSGKKGGRPAAAAQIAPAAPAAAPQNGPGGQEAQHQQQVEEGPAASSGAAMEVDASIESAQAPRPGRL